jgi:uncharacterized protein YbjT (DUF2867 family)
MKYVITGGAGHISKPLTEKLLDAGHDVTVIGRNAEHLESLTTRGAKAAIGTVDDVDFLISSFIGVDAVYTMIPPPGFGVKNWKAHIGQIGKNYAQAIGANHIKYVVNLSSVGADMENGAGPVSGLYHAEQALNELGNINIKHLRPGYFFHNLLSNIAMIKNMNMMGANFGGPDMKLVMVDPVDIAAVAAEQLLGCNFKGHSVQYIAGDERTTDDIAETLGTAIGKPDLKWMVFNDDQALNGMIQGGLPMEMAKNFVEMNNALRTGAMSADYWKNRPAHLQKTKLEDFAKIFAEVYSQEDATVNH